MRAAFSSLEAFNSAKNHTTKAGPKQIARPTGTPISPQKFKLLSVINLKLATAPSNVKDFLPRPLKRVRVVGFV